MRLSMWSSLIVVLLAARSAHAETLKVGPAAAYTKIDDAMAVAKPGDVVEVEGDHTYPGTIMFRPEQSGTATAPITVRGILVNGHRPILTGIGAGQYDNMVVLLNANHFVLESFEIVGDRTLTNYCLVHKADDVRLSGAFVQLAKGKADTRNVSQSCRASGSVTFGEVPASGKKAKGNVDVTLTCDNVDGITSPIVIQGAFEDVPVKK